ncbi:hypothetical protein X975_24047, partial [Stegodyphus mimosarum]
MNSVRFANEREINNPKVISTNKQQNPNKELSSK